MRTQDAVPDELEIIPEGSNSIPSSSNSQRVSPTLPDGISIPKTVVEKVDPTSPSHGDVPGSAAHSIRKADAVPDVILKAPDDGESPSDGDRNAAISPEMPIPKTILTKVDSIPSHGEVPGTEAFDLRKGDAKPDIIEKKGDVSGKQRGPAQCCPMSQ